VIERDQGSTYALLLGQKLAHFLQLGIVLLVLLVDLSDALQIRVIRVVAGTRRNDRTIEQSALTLHCAMG